MALCAKGVVEAGGGEAKVVKGGGPKAGSGAVQRKGKDSTPKEEATTTQPKTEAKDSKNSKKTE